MNVSINSPPLRSTCTLQGTERVSNQPWANEGLPDPLGQFPHGPTRNQQVHSGNISHGPTRDQQIHSGNMSHGPTRDQQVHSGNISHGPTRDQQVHSGDNTEGPTRDQQIHSGSNITEPDLYIYTHTNMSQPAMATKTRGGGGIKPPTHPHYIIRTGSCEVNRPTSANPITTHTRMNEGDQKPIFIHSKLSVYQEMVGCPPKHACKLIHTHMIPDRSGYSQKYSKDPQKAPRRRIQTATCTECIYQDTLHDNIQQPEV